VATTCTYVNSSGGPANTLADVAEYYYKTDIRTSALGNNIGALGTDVSANVVPSSGLDSASWQHMTTFTLGLGAVGRMIYSPTYQSDLTGDYVSVKTGATTSAAAGVCSWQTTGACNWPTPNVSGTPENVDDLWHAAVNGRGTYFSATNPTTLTAGLTSALLGVTARTGSASAATTSNPNVTSGDNFIFDSTFTSVNWDGELTRSQLDLATGIPSTTADWSARDLLDAMSLSSRVIYTRDSTAASGLKSFTWAALTPTEQAYFNLPAISTLSQFCTVGATCLSAADQTTAAGANLVSFLGGDRTHEGTVADLTTYYRQRIHLLGDIVDAEAAYVKLPGFSYTDTGYSAYITAQATRNGQVYVGADDGMLHAFDATTGNESWAYVPALVMPNLYKLADKNYSSMHQYYVDGTPKAGDAFFQGAGESAPAWHTILVGGLNSGGRGYYALDVTDPASPKVLWEFTDTNMGYTYGNPVIAKLNDSAHTWAVFVTSGYNNVSPGDGVGRLYVLNAGTGALIRTISTSTGSTGTPSGLGRIAGWVDDSAKDNTVLRIYGGDLLGNVWRFDVNGDVGSAGYDAQKLVTLVDASGNPQPITVQPELDLCSGLPVVFVGTGRYLGTTDLTNTQQQSFYAVKDNLNSTTLGNPRTAATSFVKQTETASVCPANVSFCKAGEITRTSSSNAVDFSAGHNNGWYLDFLDSGERDNTDPSIVLGSVIFNTNVPDSSACVVGGYSYSYFLNACTGAAMASANGISTVRLASGMATRPVAVELPSHSFVSLTRVNAGTVPKTFDPDTTGGTTRRVSWRELTTEQ